MTSLKLLQSLVCKNEFFTKTLLKREYYRLFYRSQVKTDLLQHQMKFNPYGNLNIHKSYMSKQFSVTNNLYLPIIIIYIIILIANLIEYKFSICFCFRTEIDFEQACNETLESLYEYFEQIVEDNPHLENPDILFSVCII